MFSFFQVRQYQEIQIIFTMASRIEHIVWSENDADNRPSCMTASSIAKQEASEVTIKRIT